MGMNPQQPPQYGGQYPPPPPQPTPQPPNRWGPTSLGMEANVAAGLSYIPIVGLIFFFVEKTNRFVKFHAAQAILIAIAWIVVDIILNFFSTAFTVSSSVARTTTGAAAASGGALFFGCLGFLIGLAFFALLVWGLVNGLTDKYVKFPIIGDIAERWAGGPATPLY